MKLYIESVFDKTTNKLEDAKKKAIQTANVVEKKFNNLGAAKIYYFATAIDKLIVTIGNIGAKAMGIKNQILTIKDIPDIKLGDIPSKFARYQELVIPAVSLKEQKVIFTKLKDMNGENDIVSQFSLKEIANNNPVYDYKDYKVEIIDEQPKFLKIEPNQLIWGKISFMVGAFGTVEPEDRIKILVNGQPIEIQLNIAKEKDNGYTDEDGKIITNNSQYFADIEKVEFNGNTIKDQKTKYPYSKIAKVTLTGYFYEPLNISILGKTDQDFKDEAFGYIQKSLNLEDLKPFEIPAPYTNVATKVDGIAMKHETTIKTNPFKDGLTFGGLFMYETFGDRHEHTPLVAFKPVTEGARFGLTYVYQAGRWAFDTGEYHYISTDDLPVPAVGKPFYAQISLNFKSKTATFQINDKKFTMEIKPNDKPIDHITFGGKDTLISTNMWYWIGDTADIEDNN